MNSITQETEHRPVGSGGRLVCAFLLSILALALFPIAAQARPVNSSISATAFGIIDAQATVRYYFTGNVSAENLVWRCMENRRVDLFRVGPEGSPKRVSSTKTKLLGKFVGAIEKPLSTIAGHYFVKMEPRVRKTRRGRLRCLGARSPSFLLQVPSGLSE